MIDITNRIELENFALQEQIKMNSWNSCVELFNNRKDIQDIIFHDNDDIEKFCTKNDENWDKFQKTLNTINIRKLNMQLLDYYDKKGVINMNVQTILEELPKRFHEDFMKCIVDEESIKSLRKIYDYFLEEIIDELTQEEKDNIFVIG